jgi:hypothetical protein
MFNLGCSTPCWNDKNRGGLLRQLRSLQRRIFKEGGHEVTKQNHSFRFFVSYYRKTKGARGRLL